MNTPLLDPHLHLHELCVALGWRGGTFPLVLAEVKELVAIKRGLDFAISCDLLPSRVSEIIGEELAKARKA